MQLCFLLLCVLQLASEVTIRETASNGSWLEAHINDDRSLKELIFSDGSSARYEYKDSQLRKITRLSSQGIELYNQTYNWSDSQLDSQSGWFNTQYLYDNRGRVIAKLNPWHQETIEYNIQGQPIRIGNRIYSYDLLGQITSEQGYFEAAYDQNCNLKELNGQSIFVNPNNQIESCSYDSRGNFLRKQFVYDEKNQLIEACSTHYLYDAYGRRSQKGKIFYLYLGFEEIASFEDGRCKTLKIPGIGGPVAIEINEKPYAPVMDTQGIIRKLIDPIDNSIYAENNCDIFGNGLTDVIPYAYRGKRYDPETGLLYFGKRYYDPTWHRWLTPDPLGSVDHKNLYQYVYNNPLRYSDPTGCKFWGYVLGLGEIVAGGALMVAGGIVELGSFGTLTLGFAIAETTGAALITDGLARATFEAKDIKPPQYNTDYDYQITKQQNPSNPAAPPYRGDQLELDPKRPPTKGFEWKGKGPPGSKQGSWYNPSTGESLYPDFNHPDPIKPHWDYTGPGFPKGARLYPNGTWEPK